MPCNPDVGATTSRKVSTSAWSAGEIYSTIKTKTVKVRRRCTVARIIDEIETYIRRLLDQSGNGTIDVQRAEVALLFDCVPSQVTYVLMTRFTPDRGYLVEGRRGGGGGIRIHQLDAVPVDLLKAITEVDKIDQARALDIVTRLYQAQLITEREASLMNSALDRDTIKLELPFRDVVRARLLKAMVTAILKPKGAY